MNGVSMEGEFKCPVCHEFFKDPVMLQCTHHVCVHHLGNVSPGDRLACPVCNDVTLVPDTGLVVDKVLQVVVDNHKGSSTAEGSSAQSVDPPTCGCCEERFATKRCLQCVGFLCEECLSTTHSKGFFKSHTVVELDSLASSVDALGNSVSALGSTNELKHQMLCNVHVEEKLNFYCLDCRTPVCAHCLILGDHKGHNQTPIDQAFVTGKETLGAWVDKLSQRISSLDTLLGQLHNSQVEVSQGAEAQRNVINHEMDHLRELIETKRHQLLSKSALEEKQKQTQLQDKVDLTQASQKHSQELISRAQVLLAATSEHAFLSVVLPLIHDMKRNAATTVHSSVSVNCSFRPLSTDAQVRSLGDIDLGHPTLPQTAQAGQALAVAAQLVPSRVASSIGSWQVSAPTSQATQQPSYTLAGPGSTAHHLQPQQTVPVQQQQAHYSAMYRTVPTQ